MGLSVGGLASGLDTEGIITQLLSLEQRYIQQIQRKIAVASYKQQGYNDLDNRLNSLRNAVKGFNDENLFKHAVIPAGAPALLHAPRHVHDPEAPRQLPARLPPLTDLHQGTPQPKDIPDRHIPLGHPKGRDILPKPPRRQMRAISTAAEPSSVSRCATGTMSSPKERSAINSESRPG